MPVLIPENLPSILYTQHLPLGTNVQKVNTERRLLGRRGLQNPQSLCLCTSLGMYVCMYGDRSTCSAYLLLHQALPIYHWISFSPLALSLQKKCRCILRGDLYSSGPHRRRGRRRRRTSPEEAAVGWTHVLSAASSLLPQ